MHIPLGYHERTTHSLARQTAETVWSFVPRSSGSTIILPDGRCDLIVSCRRSIDGVIRNIVPVLTGPATGPYPVVHGVQDMWLGIRLQPERARALWRDGLAGAKDRVLRGMAEVAPRFPAIEALPETLPDAGALQAILETWEQALSLDNVEGPTAQALSFIQMSGGQMPIDELAVRLGGSVRQFNRQFRAQIGLNPKIYSSIIRFHRALRLIRDHQLTTSNAAYEAGYSDQAHLIRSFQRFGGFSPSHIPDNLSLPGFSALS